MMISRLLKRLARSEHGVTLVEMIVVVGILTMGLGLIGSTVFQSLGIFRYWRADVVATREIRHAGSMFAGDALNTEVISLIDGGISVDSVTLEWIDEAEVDHTAVYAFANGVLTRNLDGNVNTLARDVVDVDFYLDTRIVTFDISVTAESGTTESRSLATYLRLLN